MPSEPLRGLRTDGYQLLTTGAIYDGKKLDPCALQRIKSVVDRSIFGVGLLYLMIGICGSMFGDSTKVIVIENCLFRLTLDPVEFISQVGRIAYAVLATLSSMSS
jgi:hypothetical protein